MVNVFSYQGIPAYLQHLADEEGIIFQQGDNLFVRTDRFHDGLRGSECNEEGNRPEEVIGMDSSVESAQWLWEKGFAAVAADAPGFEQTPIWGSKMKLHEWLLACWGMPIGEMFYLEELAKALKEQGRHTFSLTSVPLKVNPYVLLRFFF
jgi:hypothetical protein